MRVSQLCHKLLENTSFHQKRIRVMGEVVETVLHSKTLSVTSVGRKMKNACQTRSNIRKVDRLYSNQAIYADRLTVYRTICRAVLHHPHPLIVIDGSKLPNSPWYILRASLVSQGRAITLYEQQYDIKIQCSVRLYRSFLNHLGRVLGDDIQPILVTDAEFKGTWFELVRKKGWDFIGRLRGNANVALGHDSEPDDWRDLWPQATGRPKTLGEGYFNKDNEIAGYFSLYRAPNKGRHAHTRSGRRSETIKSHRQRASAAEPWLLFSSMGSPAKYIVGAYQLRMTIEESFRDMKSGRYGLGLAMTYSKNKRRYAVMLLIAALATLTAYLMGTIAEISGLHRQFQANSYRHKRVLSRFFIGCELVYKEMQISLKQWHEAIRLLQSETFSYFA